MLAIKFSTKSTPLGVCHVPRKFPDKGLNICILHSKLGTGNLDIDKCYIRMCEGFCAELIGNLQEIFDL